MNEPVNIHSALESNRMIRLDLYSTNWITKRSLDFVIFCRFEGFWEFSPFILINYLFINSKSR